MASDLLSLLAAVGTAATLFAVLRLYPLWRQRDRACDAYFFLACADALRARWRLPVQLPPKYLAEPQEQWYPPLFPALLSLLSPQWLRTRHWVVNHLLDFGVALVLFGLTRPMLGDAGAVGVVVVYAAQPALIGEFATLTSRPLGMLLQLAAITAGYAWAADGTPIHGVLGMAAVGALVYAHKLSLQLLWFLFPFLAVATGSWTWLAVLAGGYAMAAALWPSFFWKIQRAHVDIVRFWFREWPLLGAHPVRQSPLYGDGRTKTSYYDSPGIRSPLAFSKTVVQIDVFVVFVAAGLLMPVAEAPFAAFCWWWAVGVYCWVAATHFLPVLRCLGLAQQYVKFGYVPVLCYAASYVTATGSLAASLLLAACLAVLARWYLLTARAARKAGAATRSADVEELLRFLDAQPDPRVMVLPYHLSDEIAYRTRAQVLWGTHGYGFDRVRSFFPVLRRPIEEIAHDFALTHIVLDTSFARPEEVSLGGRGVAARIGCFYIFDVAPSRPLAVGGDA